MNQQTEKSVAFTAQGKAELLAYSLPPEPLPPDEIEGHTLASLISAGTELAIYRGDYFPCEIGYAAVIAVEAVGEEVEGIHPGDRVLAMAPHRSWQRVQASAVVPVPCELPAEEAAFARMMSVSMSTLATTTARPPAKVVVSGLGLVGHLAARVFDLCGYEVIACDPLEARRKLLLDKGGRRVHHAIPLEDPDVAGQVALVLECSGHERAALDGCKVVAKRGEVVLVGVPWEKKTDILAHDLLHAVFHKYAVLRSGWEWEVPFVPAEFARNSILENLAGALKWLVEGRISVEGLYTKVPPSEAQETYQALQAGRFSHLGAVFDWSRM
jgi:threonine dehydrogenase-like Zn-dependent dehydrogenase